MKWPIHVRAGTLLDEALGAEELRAMCRRVQCENCGKPTYAGCGMHIEQVLGGVPNDERCHCRDEKRDPDPAAKSAPSIMRRILGS